MLGADPFLKQKLQNTQVSDSFVISFLNKLLILAVLFKYATGQQQLRNLFQ